MSSAVSGVWFVTELSAALTHTTADHPQMISDNGQLYLVKTDFYRLNDEIQIHMAAIKSTIALETVFSLHI